MESPTESDLEISHLTTNDIEEIVEIESASFTIPWTFQMVSEELANPRSNCYKLTLSNKVIGYFCFWAVLDEAHLMNIAIHPDHRKTRIWGQTDVNSGNICQWDELDKNTAGSCQRQ